MAVIVIHAYICPVIQQRDDDIIHAGICCEVSIGFRGFGRGAGVRMVNPEEFLLFLSHIAHGCNLPFRVQQEPPGRIFGDVPDGIDAGKPVSVTGNKAADFPVRICPGLLQYLPFQQWR